MTNKQLNINQVQAIDFVKYSGVSGDFNPVHTVPEVAQKNGHSQPIAHGMYIMGLATKALEEWYSKHHLLKFEVRFLSPTYAGDMLTITEKSNTEIKVGYFQGIIEVTDSQKQVKLKGNYELKRD
ncbi:MaoC family dehydratase [Neobacillus niacini]|uniref:MaoC family dehydratase n=1 Tax=Neobacillus niacini TaxID=86668 RepID=UPI002FFF8AE8